MQNDVLVAILEELRLIRALLEKQKSPPTMMNDELEPSYFDRTQAGNEAIAFSVRLEGLYKRSGNGGYDWRTANKAARSFLSKHSPEDRERLCRFAEEHHSSLGGKLSVFPGMYEELWRFMIDKTN